MGKDTSSVMPYRSAAINYNNNNNKMLKSNGNIVNNDFLKYIVAKGKALLDKFPCNNFHRRSNFQDIGKLIKHSGKEKKKRNLFPHN